MDEMDDQTLLRQYTEQHSEAAFAALVSRHVNKVYSVAWRRTGNVHAAEEITQAVFVLLARKSSRLAGNVVLAGWLYEAARLTAVTYIRGEIRRSRREQEAHMQSTLNDGDDSSRSAEDPVWSRIAPLLDDAMARLSEADRHAIVLRYFDGKTLGEVGTALGASEDAAKKRVSRAVEKLRRVFTQRGVTMTTAALAAAISENSVQAAPLGLAAAITTTGVTGAAAGGSTLTLVEGVSKAMAWAKLKLALIAGLFLAAGTSTVVMFVVDPGDSDARRILERTKLVYSQMRTYQSLGTTVEEIQDGRGIVMNGTFSMGLSRPESYHLEYEQVGPLTTNKAHVWANSNGHYFKNLIQPVASQPAGGGTAATRFDLRLPLSGTAAIQQNFGDTLDVSGGAATIVPSLFYDVAIPVGEFSTRGGKDLAKGWDVADPRKESDESIDGVECHVLSFNAAGEKVWLWIGKQDALVYQSRQRRVAELAEFTDREVTGWMAAIRGTSETPPLSVQELKRSLNAARRKVNATGKSVTVSFDVAPGHRGIHSVTFEPPGARVRTQKHSGIQMDGDLPAAGFGP